jgi:hypothetical protein
MMYSRLARCRTWAGAVVSYEGLRFALACGIDVMDYAETYTLQKVIADQGTPRAKATTQGRNYRKPMGDRDCVG